MEKLVDIVHFLHLEIHEAFGSAGKHFICALATLDLCFYPPCDVSLSVVFCGSHIFVLQWRMRMLYHRSLFLVCL